MQYTKEFLEYNKTNSFSKIVLDYISNKETLHPFFNASPSIENLDAAIQAKAKAIIDRKTLVSVLKEDYQNIATTDLVKNNIDALLQENTFSICTAHQPNIFTGHLYFVYKILHTVQLANQLQEKYKGKYNFVPLFYMGSEDADLKELGHININNEKLEWNTTQAGAVGRMLIDENFISLIKRMEGEFSTHPFGVEIIEIIKDSYTIGNTIQQATLAFVNKLFGKYGVVILIPDNAALKSQMIPIFKEDILHNTSNNIVTKTSQKLAHFYNEQAHSRAINLFYLSNNSRERIEQNKAGQYEVLNTNFVFTESELITELETNPQNFSPNVILRGLFQETILPNIAFIGGGGELAYWLQLKELFENYKILYPILLLRNSFLLQTEKQKNDAVKLNVTTVDLFTPILDLEKKYTVENSTNQLNTLQERTTIESIYKDLAEKAALIDSSLCQHIMALKTKQLNKLCALDKKLLRAEKRNFKEGISKIQHLKKQLFPKNSLQERFENIIPYYAKYGSSIMDIILQCSLSEQSEFCVITLEKT